ncbi:MAG: tetratricopeptide repeat protein, partial [Candidatus Muiribacteriaceae bacterium]
MEQCFERKTLHYIYDTLSQGDTALADSYLEESLKNYTYEKYQKALMQLRDYYLFFAFSEIVYLRARMLEAKAMYGIGKYDRALSVFMELTNTEENFTAETFNYIGKCHYYLKDMKKAMEYTAKAVEIDHSYYKAYHNMAVYYVKTGDIPGAIECWEQVLKLNKTHKKAAGNLKII